MTLLLITFVSFHSMIVNSLSDSGIYKNGDKLMSKLKDDFVKATTHVVKSLDAHKKGLGEAVQEVSLYGGLFFVSCNNPVTSIVITAGGLLLGEAIKPKTKLGVHKQQYMDYG